MRTFGKGKIEYFEFKLEGDKKVYKIPLAAHMPFVLLDEMHNARNTEDSFPAQIRMLRRYMGDVVDELPAGTLSEIMQAWGDACLEDSGASVGES